MKIHKLSARYCMNPECRREFRLTHQNQKYCGNCREDRAAAVALKSKPLFRSIPRVRKYKLVFTQQVVKQLEIESDSIKNAKISGIWAFKDLGLKGDYNLTSIIEV